MLLPLLEVTRADVRHMLRADALYLGLGLVLLATGISAVLVYARAARPGSEPSVLWFGLFSLPYGLRLLAGTATFRLVFEFPTAFWVYSIWALTYVMPIPVLLYLRATFPR
jgi:ABC-type uncharacterized transport system permease subunit